MKRRTLLSRIAASLFAGPLLPLTGCISKIGPAYKYRLTVSANVANRNIVASSVVQVRYVVTQTIDAGSLRLDEHNGEATCLDLGDGRLLLALLEGMSASWYTSPTLLLLQLYGLPINPTDANILALSDMRGSRQLKPEQMPSFITFIDPNDSRSYRAVNPAYPDTVGPDVKSIAAEIEITDAPITSGLKHRLRWLAHQSGYLSRQEFGNQQDIRVDQLSNGV